MTVGTFADRCRLIRDTVGMGITDVKRAMDLSETPEFGGDVLLAVEYVSAGQLAYNVRGDRHAWNMDRARRMAPGLRERHPELDAAFPPPGGGPTP